ncbi:MAG: acyl-CoA dehydrogenase family protein [Salinirussus sp.]
MDADDERGMVRETVRDFVDDEVVPAAREAERTETFPEDIWDRLADLELTGMRVPETYGGLDVDMPTYGVVSEELGRGHLALATALGVHCMVTECIASFADEPIQEEWLPDMAGGRPVGAFALSEPHAGSDPAAMTTQARRDGDEYVIDGTKQWITNGERSDVIILFAKTDRSDPETVTQFLVPKDIAGLSVGPREDKLGLRASDTTPLEFDGARIPAAYRLTPVGDGLSAALAQLTAGRVLIAFQAVGLMKAALTAAVDYANEREQFGQPIIEHQAVAHMLADMKADVRAAELLARDAARRNDGDADPLSASIAKYVASETAVDVASDAIQVHGGYGYTTDFDVERYYRDAKVTTIYEGTSEIQQKIIARHLRE